MTNYFGPQEEELVKEYIDTRNEKLYNASIHPLLRSIAYGVRDRYNFRPKRYYTSPGVINGCISLLWEKLTTTWDPTKGHKAFSYLSRVAHNYFCEVSRKNAKTERTRILVSKEVGQLWNASHQYSASREDMLIEEHNSRARKRVTNAFLSKYLHSTPLQTKKILEKIEQSPRAHKKVINKIIVDTLDLQSYRITEKGPVYRRVDKCGATRRLNKVKNSFREDKISMYKKTGIL
jgi:hypothetical protein